MAQRKTRNTFSRQAPEQAKAYAPEGFMLERIHLYLKAATRRRTPKAWLPQVKSVATTVVVLAR